MPDLKALATAISTQSSKIRAYALAQAAEHTKLVARVKVLEDNSGRFGAALPDRLPQSSGPEFQVDNSTQLHDITVDPPPGARINVTKDIDLGDEQLDL